jgi:plasmid stabilization system protein ParE
VKITWSNKAEEDFDQNIQFLLEEWTETVVQDFTFETERVLKIISINPKAFQKHKKMKCQIVPITKHITLFYDVKRKEIELLRFWNNFKNPRKINLK